MMNFAFWHMKHSAMVAAKSEIDMEEAKKVNKILTEVFEGLRSLKKNIFQNTKDEFKLFA